MTIKDFVRFVNDNTIENVTHAVMNNNLINVYSRKEALFIASGLKNDNPLAISMLMLMVMEEDDGSLSKQNPIGRCLGIEEEEHDTLE